MGEATAISWTDATFNPWWGCARVSEACRRCYAESLAKRYGHDVWGKGGDRRFFGDKHWADPEKWNRQAEAEGRRRLVFCASMADVFEDHPALPPHRERLWGLIERTPWLTWQLLTKRPENIAGMVPWSGDWPANVWVGTTVETQRWADERIPHLLSGAAGARLRFLSMEPLLGPIDLGLPGIGWVITGGESGPGATPSHPDWFRSVRDQCQAAGVPYHHKQWGEWAPVEPDEWPNRRASDSLIRPDGYSWPLSEPHGTGDESDSTVTIRRFGKKVAGRELDGRVWDEVPA
ncbi:MAG: phage Gp37/Gp68 family protein [Actinomycetota bacterium]|nr:phage Gp37/Gp68 family protein [Actinomycetota bacterium]